MRVYIRLIGLGVKEVIGCAISQAKERIEVMAAISQTGHLVLASQLALSLEPAMEEPLRSNLYR